MRTVIAIGALGLALLPRIAVAQTAAEQAQILRDCLTMFPEAISATTLIARAITTANSTLIGGPDTTHKATVLQTFPATELYEFPRVLREALPGVPAPLEYRLIGNDVVIRDADADVIVSVLRDALHPVTTRH